MHAECCTSINLPLIRHMAIKVCRSHTNICFVENQLSRGTIGLSPLSTALRRIMQHSPVRSIIIWPWKDHLASGIIEVTYPDTALLNKDLCTVAFAKAINLATPINLLTHYAKGTSSFRKCHKTLKFRLLLELLIQTISLVYNKFFTISFTVLFTIAKFIILSLRGWFPFVPTSFLSSYFIVDLTDQWSS